MLDRGSTRGVAHIQIPLWYQEHGDEPHIKYTIVIALGDATTRVSRRFREFAELNDALVRQYGPGLAVPALPMRAVGAWTRRSTFVEWRRAGLEAYLQAVVAHIRLWDCTPLANFLALSADKTSGL